MELDLSPTHRMRWPYFHHLRWMLAQRLGQAAASVKDAERAVVLARELNTPSLQMPHFLARLSQAQAATDGMRR
jgi:hypothetical protein